MFKNKKIGYIVLIILFAALFYYEHKKLDKNLETIESETVLAKNKNQATLSSPSENDKKPNPQNAVVTTQPAIEPEKPFALWFAEEAKNLDARTGDSSQKEMVLKERAARFSPEQIKFLRQKATDKEATANERIAATYLLTLTNATYSLVEIAKENTSLPSPQPVHSIGETLLMQEKAIRTMAIDELFIRAATDAALRKQLPKIISEIKDEGVKQYALKRYRELKL